MRDLHFETLRDDLERLSVPDGQTRNLRWLVTPLAIGRTGSGDYEIFIRGPAINAASSLVRRHIQHGDWRPQEGGHPFSASRIVLPAAPHFASIAALISIELLRAGIAESRGAQSAFTDVEPIIEMAIRRGALSDEVVIGLIGELTVLRQILLARGGEPAKMLRCLNFWQGWQEGGRDFRIGDHVIEVKTTQATGSIHQFSGLHQLEPSALPSGAMEQMHLMSIGLSASNSVGETLPSMVSSIAKLLSVDSMKTEVADEFIRRVEMYGTISGSGYAHERMQAWSVYATRYAHTFVPRLYRLDDPAMLTLTRDTLAQTFVLAEGLTFTMHIPERVSAFNPVPNWDAELEAMASA
ncbi:PD-(D/E)XK motif protein [Devosia sp. BK]|uniref:PD-(D/E)XK motif protein n=1 Tax=Devosia sp. BK TaxID=2871706 RepID=UPI00293A2516|nr:PD-(D/E)XK motif protein [Devosia sp. BK]MDV3253556.1 PD-(D/E)XK motif protein [Devosia sp. BK]